MFAKTLSCRVAGARINSVEPDNIPPATTYIHLALCLLHPDSNTDTQCHLAIAVGASIAPPNLHRRPHEHAHPRAPTRERAVKMPKFFCDYCDVYLTHDSMSVRKAHNSGRNHLRNVVDYYQQIGHEKAQAVIDGITSSYAAEGQSMPLQPQLSAGQGGGPPGFSGPPPPGMPGFGALPPGMRTSRVQ